MRATTSVALAALLGALLGGAGLMAVLRFGPGARGSTRGGDEGTPPSPIQAGSLPPGPPPLELPGSEGKGSFSVVYSSDTEAFLENCG